MKAIDLCGVFLVLATACKGNGEVVFRPIPVEGLPRCDQDAGMNFLQRPVLLEVKHGTGTLRRTISGADPNPQVALAERAEDLTVRVALCNRINPSNPRIECENPSWVGEPLRVRLDPRAAGAKLTVQVPGTHPCVR